MPRVFSASEELLPTIDNSALKLFDAAFTVSVAWLDDPAGRTLYDNAGVNSVKWQQRQLRDASNAIVYTWSTGIFSTAQTFSSTITNSTLTASSAVVSDGSKVLTSSATTATQIGYLSTTTSDVQVQIDALTASGLTLGQALALANGQTLT